MYIDGIPQITLPHVLNKPAVFQELPEVPNWDKEKNDTIKWDGLPPLQGTHRAGTVVISGVKSLIGFNEMPDKAGDLETVFDDSDRVGGLGISLGRTVVVQDGKIVCVQGRADDCADEIVGAAGADFIDLKGGSIAPGLTTYGSPLGLVEIRLEPSTNDGGVLDPLVNGDLPSLLKGKAGVIRAVDGLAFEGRNLL